MSERFLNIGIQLVVGESPVEAGIEKWSNFLHVAHSLNLGRVIGNAAPELYAGFKQAELWADLKAKDGVFNFELATELNVKKVTDAIDAAEKLLAFLHQ
jgi:hypothetical protein